MNIPLSTFPAPLLRLILCGGKGLAPAWGPLKHTDEDCETPWCPTFGAAIVSSDEGRGYLHTDPINESDGWSIPLDDASPWPARLALVSTWMLDLPCLAAQVQPETPELFFSLVMMPADPMAEELRFIAWGNDGSEVNTDANGHHECSLPTLPHHLQTHPRTVAMLLALYDVPEIRARVESA